MCVKEVIMYIRKGRKDNQRERYKENTIKLKRNGKERESVKKRDRETMRKKREA